MNGTELEQRIERLEAQVREQRRRSMFAFALAGVLGAATLVACQQAGTDPRVPGKKAAVKPPAEVRLTSEDGTHELVLTPEGLFLKANGADRLELKAGADASSLTLRDPAGRRRAALLATAGPAALSLLNNGEKDAAVLAVGEGDTLARLELFGAATADPRAGLSVAPDGRGALTVVSAAQRPAATPVATPSGMPNASPTATAGTPPASP